jgi:hypothetical protein
LLKPQRALCGSGPEETSSLSTVRWLMPRSAAMFLLGSGEDQGKRTGATKLPPDFTRCDDGKYEIKELLRAIFTPRFSCAPFDNRAVGGGGEQTLIALVLGRTTMPP